MIVSGNNIPVRAEEACQVIVTVNMLRQSVDDLYDADRLLVRTVLPAEDAAGAVR
jgi:hypothetical protein